MLRRGKWQNPETVNHVTFLPHYVGFVHKISGLDSTCR
jgi:hypothetical protein